MESLRSIYLDCVAVGWAMLIQELKVVDNFSRSHMKHGNESEERRKNLFIGIKNIVPGRKRKLLTQA